MLLLIICFHVPLLVAASVHHDQIMRLSGIRNEEVGVFSGSFRIDSNASILLQPFSDINVVGAWKS